MTNIVVKLNKCQVSNGKTSDRYNRGQLYNSLKEPSKKALFTVDWFEINCLHGLGKGILRDYDPEDMLDEYSSSFTVLRKDLKTGNGTKMYKVGYDVSFNGQSIGLLLLTPRQSFKDEFSCSLKIHNHILYQSGWTLLVEAVLDDIGLQINNFTRIDIACDSIGFMEQYKKFNTGFYQNIGRSCHRNYQTSKNVITGFDIGSKSSNKMITGYRKGKNLELTNKNYISDYWAKNNLDIPFDKVERLELKLRNKAIKTIKDFNYTRLEEGGYLASIFKTQIENFYQFVLTSDISKDCNISRAKRIDVIDWNNIDLYNVIKMKKIKKPSSVWAAKRYITFGLQMIEAGYYHSEDLFTNAEYIRVRKVADEFDIIPWLDSLVKRIADRDKSLIAEMRYNRMEIEAGNKGIYNVSH